MNRAAQMIWRSQRLRSILVVFAAIHVAFQLFAFVPAHWNRRDNLRDTPIFYQAARNAKLHASLYRKYPNYGPNQMIPHFAYFYLPQFAAIIAPLAEVSPIVFSRIWYGVLIAAFWTFAASLTQISRGQLSADGVLIWGLILGMTPGVYFALSTANADPIMWALFGMAIATRGRGVFFAIAAQLKLYTLLPLVLAAWKEGGRVTAPSAAILFCGFAIGVVVCGIHSYQQWSECVIPVIRQGTFFPGDVSLSLAGLRLARHLGWRYVSGPLPEQPQMLLTLASVLAPLAATYFARKQEPVKLYCYSTIAIVFCSPLCWNFYVPICYPLIALFIRDSRLAFRRSEADFHAAASNDQQKIVQA